VNPLIHRGKSPNETQGRASFRLTGGVDAHDQGHSPSRVVSPHPQRGFLLPPPLLPKMPTTIPSSSVNAGAAGPSSSRRSELDAYSSCAVPTSVWISHPLHPFYAQEVTVLGPINSPAGLAFRVRYPDGSTAPLPREWASSAPIRAVPTDTPRCLLSLIALRELAVKLATRTVERDATTSTSRASPACDTKRREGRRPSMAQGRRRSGSGERGRRGEERHPRRASGPGGETRSEGNAAKGGKR
jgi:hypothetical protein